MDRHSLGATGNVFFTENQPFFLKPVSRNNLLGAVMGKVLRHLFQFLEKFDKIRRKSMNGAKPRRARTAQNDPFAKVPKLNQIYDS